MAIDIHGAHNLDLPGADYPLLNHNTNDSRLAVDFNDLEEDDDETMEMERPLLDPADEAIITHNHGETRAFDDAGNPV